MTAFSLDGAARLLFLLHERLEVGDRLLHDPGALHHLGEEHLPRAEEIAHHVHPVHERTLDHRERAVVFHARFLGIRFDVLDDAVDERVLQPLLDRALAPPFVPLLLFPRPGVLLGVNDELFRGFRGTIEEHVLDELPEGGIDVVVDRELAGVDDAHVEPRLDRVIEKAGVHRLADVVVAAKGEREVADAAGDLGALALFLDEPRRFDEGARVAVVLLDTRRDGEHVGIEDDVFRRESHFFRQDAERALRDRHLVVDRRCLTGLVEGHHDDRGAVGPDLPRLFLEYLLALLEADGVHHPFPLEAFQAGLDHRELGGVHHDGEARDVGLRRDEVEKRGHHSLGVEQSLVHVDVEDVRAAFHLISRDLERFLVGSFLHQPREFHRTGHVGPLAHEDEVRVRPDGQGLEAGEAGEPRRARGTMRGHGRHRVRDGADVVRRGPAAAAREVEKPLAREARRALPPCSPECRRSRRRRSGGRRWERSSRRRSIRLRAPPRKAASPPPRARS